MKTVTGNFARPDVSLPIVVGEDTLFKNCNFSQPTPHTVVFDVKPGVAVEFEDCNLVNVTVPDGATVVGGNGRHGVRVATDAPNGGKPYTTVLCECQKCCTYLALLRERISAGTLPKDSTGRVLHSDLKDAARARRQDATALAADRTRSASDNAAALAKYGKTVTLALRTSLGRGA